MTLLDRLKAASGPDRELDAEIAVKYGGYFEGRGRDGWFAHKDDPDIFSGYCPNYTGSVDAALTLVPKGFIIKCEQVAGEQHFAEIYWCSMGKPKFKGESKINLPLAICIAAIQAKGTSND